MCKSAAMRFACHGDHTQSGHVTFDIAFGRFQVDRRIVEADSTTFWWKPMGPQAHRGRTAQGRDTCCRGVAANGLQQG